MILFSSLAAVQAMTVVAIAALLWFGTGKQPLWTVYRFVRILAASRMSFFFFLAMLAILYVNTHEVKFESLHGVDYDLTGYLTGWEGAWQAHLQQFFRSGFLTSVSAFFYIVMFQSVIVASLGIYAARRDMKLFYAFCAALLLNYAAALPMYWLVPVNEAWYANPAIRFLMLDAFPTFERDYRGMSGLNNCFPSLHTSISVTLALLASRSGIRRWAAFAWVNAIVIIFSIFYLGIHWFTDMAGGVALALLSMAAGLRAGAWAERKCPASTAGSKAAVAAARSAET